MLVSPVELNEVLATLSLAGDTANGVPFETSLRTCVIVGRIAEVSNVSREARDAAWQAALLRFLGCTAFSHEEAEAFGGSDIVVRRLFDGVEQGQALKTAPAAWAAVDQPGNNRALRFASVVARTNAIRRGLALAACDVGQQLALRLGMSELVASALAQLHERWDGRGLPETLSETDISMPARLLHVASVAEAHVRLQGADAAQRELSARAGHHLDPSLVAACVEQSAYTLDPLHTRSVWDECLSSAPATPAALTVERITRVFADFIDLKTPFSLGHSRRVADLAARAAKAAGWSETEAQQLRYAGLLHNLGNVAVGNDVWERSGSLSPSQWEQVRLHPYHGGRALERASALADLRPLIVAHHERCDGSGYPLGLTSRSLPLGARLLAVADVYAAAQASRPYRPGNTEADALMILATECDAGKLDPYAVKCLLDAIGSPGKREKAHSVLSARELEVLTCLTRGDSNKAIASRLGISAKTVQHHVRSVYQKTGARSRAAAALWAVEHGFFESA